MRMLINTMEVDLYGNEAVLASYGISNPLNFAEPTSAKSIEFALPKTANNLNIFECAHVVLNDNTTFMDFIACEVYIDGVDMLIENCVVVSVTDEINIRLFGNGSTFFNSLKGLKLADLALSGLNFTWNAAAIQAGLQTTSAVLFPVCAYAAGGYTGNNIELAEMPPAVFAKTVFAAIISDRGYSIAGDVIDDSNFIKTIIPYSNDRTRYITDEDIEALNFEVAMVNGGDQTVPSMTVATVQYDTNIQAGLWDTGTYNYLALRHLRITFQFTLTLSRATVSGAANVWAWTQHGADPPVNVFLGNPYVTTLEIKHTYSVSVTLEAGDIFWIEVEDTSGEDILISSGLSGTVYKTEVYMVGINSSIFFNDDWVVALNLPDMLQSDFFKEMVMRHAGLMQVNEVTKVITINKFATVVDAAADDWSALVDYSEQPEILYENPFAQNNWMKYEDDTNILKPAGTDKNIEISNKSLPEDNDYFVSGFGASVAINILDQNLHVVEINNDSGILPRILIAENVVCDSIDFQESGSTIFSETNINVPYFYSPRRFDLTFKRIAETYFGDVITIMQNYKEVNALMRITAQLIFKLNYFAPKFIKLYGVNFYMVEVTDFNLNKKESSHVKLIAL